MAKSLRKTDIVCSLCIAWRAGDAGLTLEQAFEQVKTYLRRFPAAAEGLLDRCRRQWEQGRAAGPRRVCR